MKRLLLNRHAEAANPAGIDDFQRPLTDNGLLQAEELGMRLKQESIIPEFWLYSTAERAKTTADIVIKALNVQFTRASADVYEASEQALLSLINKLSDTYQFAALTGHNPGISYLFYSLCGEVREVPPCTALLIEFDIEQWGHISAGTGKLKWYAAPELSR